ncbi:hypothetical protein CSUB01_09126 [Colletotrichum sublineola]|uniref:Uncharacterized protein n=1 Tax=Colletotrichum sublineola TaxID=1173701 RepID=A0A066XWA8_COLSU|nr:hypothetical protein CSUB01_09126 [Colletotrichum sublineola]
MARQVRLRNARTRQNISASTTTNDLVRLKPTPINIHPVHHPTPIANIERQGNNANNPSPQYLNLVTSFAIDVPDPGPPLAERVCSTMAAYPDAQKLPVAEKLNEQVPLLKQAAKNASKEAAAEKRKQQPAIRQERFLRRLNEAWHGDGWMLPEPFRSKSKSQAKGFKDLHYLCHITDIACKHGLDLPSL